MSITAYQASVPVFIQILEALSTTIGKTITHAAAKKIDQGVFCQARLYPDMFAFTRQVQLAADFAKNTSARLAGQEPPKWADEEKNFDELQRRIARTLAFIRALPKADIEAGGDRTITIPIRGQPMSFVGNVYLLHFALPNFYFHATTAYAILRENGVELGKGDFIGAPPSA